MEAVRVANKLIQVANVAVDREDSRVAVQAVIITAAHLLRAWARPGHEAAVLVAAASELENQASMYPVPRPPA
jgi:hypothetical protein